MKIHKEGYVLLLRTLVLIAFFDFILIKWVVSDLFIFYYILPLEILLYVFLLRFFRVPNRVVNKNSNLILSPADGKVVVVEKVFEPEYFREDRIQVSIFMSPNNIHINWVPMDGMIKYSKYHPGKYFIASHPKSSTLNERTSFVINSAGNKEILVRQIAGTAARRIVSYKNTGDIVSQGDELGFIKFGSRVDLFLPLNTKINVKLNDKVIGCVTGIAELFATPAIGNQQTI